nr:sugar phosphate isomerase/epimerase family protein [Flavilitoribacter sp.]
IEAVIPHAEANGVQLAIEPLHPMYADTRSAVNTLEQANDMAEYFDSAWVGIAVDVYHLWWDPNLQDQIARCGRNGNLAAFHICDWNTPTSDMLNDRGLMGEGCIPLKQISDWVDKTGFSGYREVEIFSNRFWQIPQPEFLEKIITAYRGIW